MAGQLPRIVPLGDAAVLADFSDTLDLAVNARIQQLAAAIRVRRVPWIRDVVPALGSLALHFDPDLYDASITPLEAAAALVADCLAKKLPSLEDLARTVEVPVCHDADLAPDLAEVAERCKLKVEEAIRRHCASPHRVLMVGFRDEIPGAIGSHASIVVALERRDADAAGAAMSEHLRHVSAVLRSLRGPAPIEQDTPPRD